MGIKIGVYDFFSRVIPGGIVVIAILYLLQKDLLLSKNPTNFSILQLVGLTIFAYILGYILTPISWSWYRIFRGKNLYKEVIDELGKEFPFIEFDLSTMDWFTLLAFIKRHNMEMSQEIEQFNVTSIMLRNASLGILIFAAIFAIEFIFSGHLLQSGFLSVFCVFVSVVLVKESVKFRTWFCRAICQAVIAFIAEPQHLSIKFKSRLSCELDEKN